MTVKITSLGAAREVTGSCHWLQIGGYNILVDCGMFQGPDDDEKNPVKFPFKVKDLDFVLITHAHLDHCGRLPLLVKNGFRGKIITTRASRDLVKLVLLDAAHVQQEDYKRAKRRAKRRKNSVQQPLYDMLDVLEVMDYMNRTASYNEPVQLFDDLSVEFHDAGHILGSAFLSFEYRGKEGDRRIVFSGDLGSAGRPILRDLQPRPPADIVYMETTYGGRLHRSLEDSVEEFYDVVTTTINRGGNVVIPAFALERSQELLYYLREGIESGRLPEYLPVFLDSPMAISATEIYRKHPECFDKETMDNLVSATDPFDLPNLVMSCEAADSMAINRVSGAVIIAGSGMCNGGRILHHLKHNIWKEKSSIVFIGYAAHGTLARRIVDGEERIKLWGEEFYVRAQIHTINGFSAHADQKELLEWLESAPKPGTTVLVHGDPERGMDDMCELLQGKGYDVRMPELGQELSW